MKIIFAIFALMLASVVQAIDTPNLTLEVGNASNGSVLRLNSCWSYVNADQAGGAVGVFCESWAVDYPKTRTLAVEPLIFTGSRWVFSANVMDIRGFQGDDCRLVQDKQEDGLRRISLKCRNVRPTQPNDCSANGHLCP